MVCRSVSVNRDEENLFSVSLVYKQRRRKMIAGNEYALGERERGGERQYIAKPQS